MNYNLELGLYGPLNSGDILYTLWEILEEMKCTCLEQLFTVNLKIYY